MYKQRPVRLLLTCVLSTFLLLAGCGGQQQAADRTAPSADCISSGWPQDVSDLQPDPSLTFGTLENGLRYVVKPNHEPKNRVGMYLDVQTGSLQETEDQRGLAHYLEHMVFNGTTHYPPGTLVEYFQSIGMGFGADTNAHTSYDETVYKLLLPGGDRETLDTGLVVLADYARGALLLEKEVDKERGVILSEKRARNSARSRVFKARMKFTFAGTKIAERDVIGTDATINNADSQLLREYYDRWYRPDNSILVVVGDADPQLVEELIRERFSDLQAAEVPVDCPEFGRVAEGGMDALYVHEPDLGYTNVTIETIWNSEPRPYTRAEEIRVLKEYIAGKMMDNRLKHLVNSKDSLFTRANFYSGRIFKRFGNSSIDARTTPENWQQALTLLDTTLRQALVYGFSDAELERVKQELLTRLKKEVKIADSRKSSTLADGLIHTINRNEVYLSPAQELALYAPVLKETTLDQANAAFRGLWHSRRLVEVTGTADVHGSGDNPEAVIRKAYLEAEKQKVDPWMAEQAAAFPYLPAPVLTAKVAEHTAFSSIGVDRYLLANGVILNLKQTDFAPNEVNAAVIFGDGKLSEPEPGLGMFAEGVVRESGLGGLTKEQLAMALAAHSSRVSFRVGEEYFAFRGKGLTSETELLFQLLSTSLLDPAFRPSGYQRTREQMLQMYGQLGNTVEGVMQLQGEQFLAGGNLRYGMVPLADMKKVTLGQVQQWLTPIMKDAGLEISVAGDFDRDEVIRLAGLYFGGQRKNVMPAARGSKITFPAGRKLTLPVASASDRALVTVAWPTADFWDISRTRRLSVLSSILDDRLRKQIREELGATYSPVVYNRPSKVDPGFGVLRSQMIVAPDQAEMLMEKLKEIGAGLALGKISEDELERALEPTLISIRDLVKSNRYWLGSVLIGSSRHPQQLEWPLTIKKDFAAITVDDIAALAAGYLQPEKAAEVIVTPK